MPRPLVVFLVGFMGCGKTAVGQALAQELGNVFIDLDDRIEHAAGRSVSSIFESEGEDGFRARERAALLALEPEFAAGAVIATGGGTFADEAARAWMRTHGETVWLDASEFPVDNFDDRILIHLANVPTRHVVLFAC